MTSLSRVAAFSAAAILLCASNVMAEGVGGGSRSSSKGDSGSGYSLLGSKRSPEMEYLYEHAHDLGITADQRRKLENLQEKIDMSREKMLRSAAMRDTYREMLAAKKEGDESAMRELKEKAREAVAKLGAGDELKDEYVKILTPEQFAKLAKEMKDGKDHDKKVADKGPEKGDREGGETKKRDPNKQPSLFDDK